MNLAQLLQQKVTPLSQWTNPKDPSISRPSDIKRKLEHINKIEHVYSLLKKPMTKDLVAQITGYSVDSCYKYLNDLLKAGRIQRCGKQPYTYWRL